MDFKEVVKNRFSCRKYSGRVVDDSVVDKILEAVWLAPSAGHRQAYKIKIVKDVELIMKVGESMGQEDRFVGATLMMVFFAEPKVSGERFGVRGEEFFCVQDATIACAYAQLAAADLGVSSLWVGAFEDAKLMELCGEAGGSLAGLKPVAISLFGYAEEGAKGERAARRDLKEILIDFLGKTP